MKLIGLLTFVARGLAIDACSTSYFEKINKSTILYKMNTDVSKIHFCSVVP